MKRIRVAAILPINSGFAFMHRAEVKNRPIEDYYTFPGGGLEENETLEEGTAREIKEEFGIEVKVGRQLYYLDKETMEEYFFLCEYISGEFGTGEGPEFSGDIKYKDSGKYIPEIVKKEDLEKIVLLPPEIRGKFLEDIKKGEF